MFVRAMLSFIQLNLSLSLPPLSNNTEILALYIGQINLNVKVEVGKLYKDI